MKRYAWLIFAAIICVFFMTSAAASEPAEAEALPFTLEASDAADADISALADEDETSYTKIPAGGSVTLTAESGISSLYVLFDRIYGKWTLSDGVTDIVCGTNEYLHEYIDVEHEFGYAPSSLTLTFRSRDCSLSELYAFGAGDVPPWVQIWEPPCEEADLILASTHIDDEQLFFAGVLPYYAGELGLDVQVVYFTSPFTYHERQHEQLNGLWTVGVRHYPVSGEFRDAYSENAKDAYEDQTGFGFTRDDMVLFQVRIIRRFRPHVVVGHDINGEYSHGQHIINCETLMDALDLAADETFDPESAAEYGVWDTPKTYIHLWEENPIVMDWDIPLESFGGKTAFQVTQDGFRCHKSQQWTWFRRWIYGKNNEITKASEIKTYSPCLYGLYRTTVGLDVSGGDMFENIPQSYAEIRAEEARREEESRAESERVESERIESERAESERLRLEEESRRAEESRLAALADSSASGSKDSDGTDKKGISPVTAGVVIAALSAAIVITIPQIRQNNGSKKRRNHGGSRRT